MVDILDSFAALHPSVWRYALVGPPGEDRDGNDQQGRQPQGEGIPDLHPQHGNGQYHEHADGCHAFAAQAQDTNAWGNLRGHRVSPTLGEEGINSRLQAEVHIRQEARNDQEQQELEPQSQVADQRLQSHSLQQHQSQPSDQGSSLEHETGNSAIFDEILDVGVGTVTQWRTQPSALVYRHQSVEGPGHKNGSDDVDDPDNVNDVVHGFPPFSIEPFPFFYIAKIRGYRSPKGMIESEKVLLVAVIRAIPSPTAVTTPCELTVATSGRSEW